MTGAAENVAFPVRLGIDEMKRLLVADFRGDPEFIAIEPQLFDDTVNGKGLRVLRYRRDGRVDVYWEPTVRVNRRDISIGAGIADFSEVPIEPAIFEIADRAVHVDIRFVDRQTREVRLKIVEREAPSRRFSLLAPVGKDVQDPVRLFLVQMHGFDFVRRKGTEVVARIGDRALTPATFPIPRGGHKVYFIRYAADPIIAFLNPPMPAPIEFSRPSSSGRVRVEGMTISLDSAGAITHVSTGSETRGAELEFGPAWPNLLDLADGASTQGRWRLEVARTPITGGTFAIAREGDEVSVALEVTEPWSPSELPWSFRLFTWIVRSFRTWPTTYAWTGSVHLRPQLSQTGQWRRIHGDAR